MKINVVLHKLTSLRNRLGIFNQSDLKNVIDEVKFNQLNDDSAEIFEVAHAVNFADLEKQAE